MTYSEIVSKLMDNNSDIAYVSKISDKAMKRLSEIDPMYYNDIMNELEDMYYSINEADAIEIVRSMRDKGEVWSIDVIENYLSSKGITDNIVRWYLVMNMVANDFSDTANTFIGGDKTEFFFSLAKDFITDRDAKPHKVEKYFRE